MITEVSIDLKINHEDDENYQDIMDRLDWFLRQDTGVEGFNIGVGLEVEE